MGKNRPTFCVPCAKKYTGLKKKTRLPPVLAVVTNKRYENEQNAEEKEEVEKKTHSSLGLVPFGELK